MPSSQRSAGACRYACIGDHQVERVVRIACGDPGGHGIGVDDIEHGRLGLGGGRSAGRGNAFQALASRPLSASDTPGPA